jgi:hypothetical protein
MAQQWRSWDILRQEVEKLGHYNEAFLPHPRYVHGELRIDRLNFLAAVIRLRPWEHFFHAKSRHLEYWSSFSK